MRSFAKNLRVFCFRNRCKRISKHQENEKEKNAFLITKVLYYYRFRKAEK